MSTISSVRFWLPLDAQSGPASRISRARAASIVAAVMNHEVTTSRIDVKRPPPRGRPWRKVAFLAAAALVLPVTVIAGAVRYVATRRPTPNALLVAARAPAPRAETRAARRPVESPAAASPEARLEIPAPADADVSLPIEPSRARPAAAAPRSPASSDASPQDMLQKANDLRVQHQWLAATQLYEKTLRTFPGRAEAYSAMVAAGVLRLDQLGDPKGALALFSSAIRARPRGSLSEEARWGAIQAYRALGDRSAERSALQEFVSLHPQSLLAWRANARLRELHGDTVSP